MIADPVPFDTILEKGHRSLPYRRDIDGLRGIAVLLVLLFHADLGFRGGFIGVDVFFVISGYLITGLILKDLYEGRFSLIAFWERRARRILPALTVVLLATFFAGAFLLLPPDYRDFGESALYQSVFGANFFFWQDANYFSPANNEKVLLHTWSLAVEEQFYLLVPLLLLLFRRSRAFGNPSRRLLYILIPCALISLAVSIAFSESQPNLSFYLLPSRAWELLAGSLLVLVPRRVLETVRPWGTFLGGGGLAAIFVAAWFFDDETTFPGYAALLPVLGAVAVIMAGSVPGASPIANRLLTNSKLVFVGLISYSLYLWHWPLFAFAHYIAMGALSFKLRLALALASFPLAYVSWRFIETPFRKRSIAPNRGTLLRLSLATISASAALGALIWLSAGFPTRINARARNYIAANDDRMPIQNQTIDDIRRGNLPKFGQTSVPPTVLLWGDSHARALKPALDILLKEKGLCGVSVTYSATAPVLGEHIAGPTGLQSGANELGESVIRWARENGIQHTFLVAYWEAYPRSYTNDLPRTVAELNAAGSKVHLVAQIPSQNFDVPRALAFSAVSGHSFQKQQRTANAHQQRSSVFFDIATRLVGASVDLVDPAPLFLNPETNRYNIELNGNSLYSDKNHITTAAAKALVAPWLAQHLKFN